MRDKREEDKKREREKEKERGIKGEEEEIDLPDAEGLSQSQNGFWCRVSTVPSEKSTYVTKKNKTFIN